MNARKSIALPVRNRSEKKNVKKRKRRNASGKRKEVCCPAKFKSKLIKSRFQNERKRKKRNANGKRSEKKSARRKGNGRNSEKRKGSVRRRRVLGLQREIADF